ncbi:MAG TPA: ATP phosphoribosyltransferase regulatory subunit [Deltaproteobacteria bacterium]|nr:ATP phosphoribosyltransferase regulatory subunit [Deltaproteobacteria bacterium]
MVKTKQDISLPRGVSDYLAVAADRICAMEAAIRQVAELWGFRRIITPNLEYDDVISIGVGEDLKNNTYRFEDRQSGRLLTFPPDITPQIARIVATRLHDRPMPQRICYSGRVLRQTEIQAGRSREIFQTGVELIGLDSPEADAEMVAMVVESLQRLGFNSFRIDLGQVEYCRGVMAASGLDGAALQKLQQAVTRKDASAVAALLDEHGVGGSSRQEIMALPRLFGGREILDEADRITTNPRSRAALQNLRDVLEILDIHGVSNNLTFDLGETRGLYYHTGITFEAFVSGIGEPVCSGGRYDGLTGRYGFDATATGFTFNVLTLLQAQEHGQNEQPVSMRDFLIFNSCSDRRAALEAARLLRERGYKTARDIICRNYEDSLEYARRMRFRCMLVIAEDGYRAVRTSDGKVIELQQDDLNRADLMGYLELQ